jgi:hypothetical protein
MSITDAWNAVCKAGNATLTTVPSINAMLEARIVAIKTQGPLHSLLVLGAMRAADSSHGDLMGIIIRGPILTLPYSCKIKSNSK